MPSAEFTLLDRHLGELIFANARGLQLATVASVLTRHLPPKSLGAVAGEPRFAFARDHVAIWGVVRDGVIVSMEMQRVDEEPGPTEEERDAAARALVALGNSFGLSLKGSSCDDLDLADEDGVRRWLGAAARPAPPTPEEALLSANEMLARGDKPDESLLFLALSADGADGLVEQLVHNAKAKAKLPEEELPKAPVGKRDVAAMTTFSMTFQGYELVGRGISIYANAARKRFRDRGAAPSTISGARACLFFECRRRVHQSTAITEDEWKWLDALLAAASAKKKK